MKITLIIPIYSAERFPMLIRTVKSIQAGSYKDVHIVIVADGNPEICKMADKQLRGITIILNEKRMDWNASINRILKEFDSEYYIYASDDLIFPPDCIECAMRTMRKRFPDGFGVVGIGRKNRGAFGLFGRKWADHFPDHQVFCPDLIHYGGDTELYRAANKLGKFAYPPERESQVKHFRPKDETWKLVRKIRGRDRSVFFKRQEKGYLWGVDFNLVTK